MVPDPVDRDRIAGDAGLGAGDQPLLLEDAVDQGRFAGVGAADDRELERRVALGLFLLLGAVLALDIGAEMLEQVDHALAMLGAHRDRLAEAQGIGFENARFAAAALGLVGGEDDRRLLAAQPARDFLVLRGQPGTRVDDEQGDVGLAHRGGGLRAHLAEQGIGILVLVAGGVDHPEFEPEQIGLALAPVAGHARAIVDEREPFAHQPVEQGGFADVRPADNRYDRCFRHDSRAVGA